VRGPVLPGQVEEPEVENLGDPHRVRSPVLQRLVMEDGGGRG
jgi:hypothetical protein